MSRALPALFSAALLGAHLVVTLTLATLGPLAVIAWIVLTVSAVSVLVRRERARRVPAGRTCTCCTSTVYDPVTVVEEGVR